ncbi:MAG: hypothetical protein O7J95_01025 [Planctomycetota bacterium]|nr:hypothetical protein [Planctomycetota bacterium]
MPLSRPTPVDRHPVHRLHVLAFLAVLPGCASPWKQEAIYSVHPVFLYREYEVDDDRRLEQGFAHPATVPEEELGIVLRQLYHEKKSFLFGEAKPDRVFTDDEVEAITRPLVEALAKVGKDERVRFLITRASLSSLFIGISGVSGVAFQTRDGKLHLAFDSIDQGINEGDGGRPEDVTFPYDPTGETYRYGLLPLRGTEHHRDTGSGDVYRRWLEIDFDAVRHALERARQERATASSTTTQRADTGPGTADARQRTSNAAPPVAATAPTTPSSTSPSPTASAEKPAGTVTTPSAGAGSSTAAVRDREKRYQAIKSAIEDLQRLRDDGVLTQEQYDEQLKKYLEQLGPDGN